MIDLKVAHFEVRAELPWRGPGSLLSAVDDRTGNPVELLFLAPDEYPSIGGTAFVEEVESARELDHPNVQRILRVEPREAGILVVMEAAGGVPLSTWQARGGVKVVDALRFSMQIADALNAAQALGLTHGRLAPEEILVSDRSFVKLRPFGMGSLGAHDSYAAPEIAFGERAAPASDIYSFGLLLGVLVTGRLFNGPQEGLVKEIVEEQLPGAGALVEQAAKEVEKIRLACLHDDPRFRLGSLAAVKTKLLELREQVELASLVATVPVDAVAPPKRTIWPVVMGALAILVPMLIWTMIVTVTRPGPPPPRAELTPFTRDAGYTADPAVSPDGKWVAFVSDREHRGNLDLYVMPLAGGEARKLSGFEEDEREPAFSPDGRTVAFRVERRGGGLFTVPFDGGEPQFLAKQGRRPRWSPDGQWIAYWAGSSGKVDLGSVYLISPAGGEPRRVAADFHSAQYPVWSPAGDRLLFAGKKTEGTFLDWWVVPVGGGEPVFTDAAAALRRKKLPQGIPGVWEDGTIYFTGNDGLLANLWKIRVDPGTGRVRGQPDQITFGEDIDGQPVPLPGGRILFSRFHQTSNIAELPLNAAGTATTGEPRFLIRDGAYNADPAVTRDGSLLVYSGSEDGLRNVYAWNRSTGETLQVTYNTRKDFHPIGLPSPDGSRIAYSVLENNRTSVYVKPAAGGEPQQVCAECTPPAAWSPAGPRLLMTTQGSNYSIEVLDLETRKVHQLTTHKRWALLNPSYSPNGRFITFHAITGSHKRQIFVVPASSSLAIRQSDWIPVTPGDDMDRDPRFSADGNRIYFLREHENQQNVWAVDLDPETKKPKAEPYLVYDPPSPRGVRLANRIGELTTAGGSLIFSQTEVVGNLWMANPPKPPEQP